MREPSTTTRYVVEDNAAALAICGQRDEHLRLIEAAFDVRVHARGTQIALTGTDSAVLQARQVLDDLHALWRRRPFLAVQDVRGAVAMAKEGNGRRFEEVQADVIQMTARGRPITAKTLGQKHYVDAMRDHGIVFCIGPAGTGKTFLAIALAVTALKDRQVSRLILTRPAVEAGEKLGFLPGDMQEKVDPYLRPLYDALVEILGHEGFQRAMERGTIEVAPLAYMRGRTLDDAFIILDEAQNTTPEQMKMALTRIGIGSKMVVAGDITQVDLPGGRSSGLAEAGKVLRGVEGIAFVHLEDADVVRNELVQRIVRAYEAVGSRREPGQD